MTEQPVHVVANFTVQDAAKYREYEKGFFPILKNMAGSSSPMMTAASPSKARLRPKAGW
nr:hypothetical protein [Sphingopyxis sp. BSNA05]